MNIFVKELTDYPIEIQQIIVSEKELIRNISLGLTKEEIRGIEKLKFTESDEELHLLLAEGDLASDVSLDVEYRFTKNQLNSITLIIYTIGQEQQKIIFDHIKEILIKKFQLDPSLAKWVIDNNIQVTIKKVGNEKEFDIELIFKQL